MESWIGLDFKDTPSGPSLADVYASVLELPFLPGTFDTVLTTQVLEHVPRPQDLIRESHRVLKVGGHLVLTAPQTNPLHEEPRDYFRYTCHGLRFLAEEAGFEILEITPLGGAIATVGQLVVWHSNWIRRLAVLGDLLSKTVTAGTSWLTLKMDRLSRAYGGGAMKETLNWLLVARKV